MSCWTELDDKSRKELVLSLEHALTVPDAPELALAVLNLAEFLEHCEKGALPIPIKLLGDTAINCRAYAKALYYKVGLFFLIFCINTEYKIGLKLPGSTLRAFDLKSNPEVLQKNSI